MIPRYDLEGVAGSWEGVEKLVARQHGELVYFQDLDAALDRITLPPITVLALPLETCGFDKKDIKDAQGNLVCACHAPEQANAIVCACNSAIPLKQLTT